MITRVRFSRWWKWLTTRPGWAALATVAAAIVLVIVGVGAASVFPAPSTGGQGSGASGQAAGGQGAGAGAGSPGASARGSGTAGPGSGSAGAAARPSAPARSKSGSPGPRSAHAAKRGTHSRAAGPAGGHRPTALRTSCRAVAHIGDSTSVGMVSPALLPSPAQRLAARYHHVGVRRAWMDASGGRSVVEYLPGQVNGYGTAQAMASRGFRGCWVIALGTNDTGNVVVGSPVTRMARIERMMSVAHGQPVLWVNVRSLLTGGPYADYYMRVWNAALHRACARYPNLRVFDWAAVAKAGWFAPDGIHYTSAGYAARARLIAAALARAFPRAGHGHGCIVR